jgi:K+ transporter
MAGSWQHSPDSRRSWWARHWANPSFSGSLIAVASVLLVMAAGLYIGAEALHLDLGHLGFASLLGR